MVTVTGHHVTILSLFVTARHRSSPLVTARHRSSPLVTARHRSSPFAILVTVTKII
jgi:hypothetical protein